MVEVVKGKTIFESDAQTLVNTINCVGVMGKGIALEFKNRYPEMFDKYKSFCDKGIFKPGVLWIYKAADGKKILNFPTKIDWKNPSKVEYIEEGLKKFVEIWQEKEIKSIAFPLLGCSNGGLDADEIIPLMQKYLEKCEGCKITIYDDRAPKIEEAPKADTTAEFFGEDENPKKVVEDAKPLVEEEPPLEPSDAPTVTVGEYDAESDEREEEHKEEKEKQEEQKVFTAPIVVPEHKLSEEEMLLKHLVQEKKALEEEIDKTLNEFVNQENTPEVRKEVTKKLITTINRRGFPMGSIFQI